jgi:hypothetical protein
MHRLLFAMAAVVIVSCADRGEATALRTEGPYRVFQVDGDGGDFQSTAAQDWLNDEAHAGRQLAGVAAGPNGRILLVTREATN